MTIKRRIAGLALAIATILPAAVPAAAQESLCEDISSYIDMVDTQIVEEMHGLVTEPGWAEDAQVAAETLNTADSDLDGVTIEVMQPLIDYLSVPGMVLDEIDPADVPDAAMPLHESARDYWLSSNGLLETMIVEGPGAAFSYIEAIETATTDNLAAQNEIITQCPEIPEEYADTQARLSELFEVIDGEGDPGLLAEATPEDMEGMGYFFLFFGEDDEIAREPARVSTPVTISTPDD